MGVVIVPSWAREHEIFKSKHFANCLMMQMPGRAPVTGESQGQVSAGRLPAAPLGSPVGCPAGASSQLSSGQARPASGCPQISLVESPSPWA